jgi:hypothetical protein
MNTESLVTYLNDHLAGSVVAIELLDQLIEGHTGTELGSFLTEMRAAIVEDQDVLKGLIHRLGVDQSAFKKAAAWFSEKVTRLKLAVGKPGQDKLALFESLEALALGVLGKRSLWQALAVVRDSRLPVPAPELARLEQRANDQYRRFEERRLQAAVEAFD